MAGYREHLTFSSVLGAAYGCAGVYLLGLDWGTALLGAGITALGGMLPDLDSDSGVPVRELFALAATLIPWLMLDTLQQRFPRETDLEKPLVIAGAIYIGVRYGVKKLFKQFTVHRGMFHSLPAMLIAGFAVFVLYQTHIYHRRAFVAVGVMIGFFSHLLLDELYSVNFDGKKIRLNKFAGSALKFWSKSAPATIATYLLTGMLGWFCWNQVKDDWRTLLDFPRMI